MDWTQIINILKNTKLEYHLTTYLMKIHKAFENEASKSPSTPFKMAFKSALQMRALAKAIQAKNDDILPCSEKLKVYLQHVEIMKYLVILN